jgi:hypothetical protein|nr:MAG TPA: hypothetical protein [Caudoviricetes sp.]
MKNIEIKLDINGEEKTFVCTKVKGILLRKTASISKTFDKLEKIFSDEILDEIADYAVEVFDKKFTREEFYNGIELDEMLPTMLNIAEEIMAKAASKIKN